MKRYKLYVFDLDGTLYRGAEPIPYAVETVNSLRAQGAEICYLTNNSSQTRSFFREKLFRMGFEVAEDEVSSSALGAAQHLEELELRSAFVVGMPGLIRTLQDSGVNVTNERDGAAYEKGGQADAVVVGICLDFTYRLMAGAMDQIGNGATFIATNADATFPLEGGKLTPGAGSIVAGIEKCSGVTPFVVGKPNPYLIDVVREAFKVDRSEILVVGDRMDTDIEAGRRAGCDTHLVLTGIEKKAPEDQAWSQDLRALLS